MELQQAFQLDGAGDLVQLETRDGLPITEQRIPSFLVTPKVLIWGLRVFAYHDWPVYREAFAYAVPVFITPDQSLEAWAGVLYEAYCSAANWKSAVSGAPLPQWDACSEAIKKCWIATAEVSLRKPR